MVRYHQKWAVNLAHARRIEPDGTSRKKRAARHAEIDSDALAEALTRLDNEADLLQRGAVISTRGTDLPATGQCHECGKSVTGERRFCGQCMARRHQ